MEKQLSGLVKQAIYSGVGFAAQGAEKVQVMLEELKKQEVTNNEQGKKIVDELIAKSETKKEEMETMVRKIVDNVAARFKGVSAAETAMLKDKIARLEAVQAAQEPDDSVTIS